MLLQSIFNNLVPIDFYTMYVWQCSVISNVVVALQFLVFSSFGKLNIIILFITHIVDTTSNILFLLWNEGFEFTTKLETQQNTYTSTVVYKC